MNEKDKDKKKKAKEKTKPQEATNVFQFEIHMKLAPKSTKK